MTALNIRPMSVAAFGVVLVSLGTVVAVLAVTGVQRNDVPRSRQPGGGEVFRVRDAAEASRRLQTAKAMPALAGQDRESKHPFPQTARQHHEQELRIFQPYTGGGIGTLFSALDAAWLRSPREATYCKVQ